VLTTAVVALLGVYAVIGLGWPNEFAGLARLVLTSGGAAAGYQPSAYGYGTSASGDVTGGAGWVPFAIAGAVLVLYGYAAVAQGRDFLRTGLPLQGALAVAFVLLAQAQVSQFLGPIWTPSWWEYHGLMLVAVVLAMGALVLELDRRRGLERFLPATVVERVIQGDPLRLEGERQTVTILFTDLRGSTALAERLTPEQTIHAVNTYLRAMARCVIDQGGILDKFTGDGVMAIFGAMGDPTPEHRRAQHRACGARRRGGAVRHGAAHRRRGPRGHRLARAFPVRRDRGRREHGVSHGVAHEGLQSRLDPLERHRISSPS
jgi:hypothetical protein